MNVGIYFDLRNPPEWRMNWSRLYGFCLELCEEAEHLGCHSVWLSEHHLFDDGYLPQPLTMAAAIAARTKRVRIGTAILIAPLHHPVEIAEQAAVVDVLSSGRLDIGLGAGYRIPEYELYGKNGDRRYGATDDCARALRDLWANTVTPPPVQERVPIWMGYGGPQGARRAGRLGESLLSVNAALWPEYRAGLQEAGHDRSRGRMAGSLNGWVTDDPESDWPLVAPHLSQQLDSYRRYMVEGTGRPTPRPIDPDAVRQSEPFAARLGYFLFGTPESVAQKVKDLVADSPVETVYFWASIGGMSEQMTRRHVETICTQLAPLLT
jgi:alkanesulfonate monooxygenase SsuD/methylene tetrahydromethanopterin reductase-like flavin-dependent oxidoreductase (luciferase family)